MKKCIGLLAFVVALTTAGLAQSAATWTATATSSDGSPLSSLFPGLQVTIDIGLVTTGPELLGISGSINNYDPNVVAPAATGHEIASSLLHQICFPSAGCFNGQTNLESGLRVENGVEGPGAEATFLSILSVTSALGSGRVDNPFPQFRIVFDLLRVGDVVLRIGTYADYADAYAGGDNVVNNVEIALTIMPEPTSGTLIGLGPIALAAKGSRSA